MPVPIKRSDAANMIVDHTQVEQDAAIRQIVALEADLFGHGAWSEHSVRQELNAPARTYLLDIEPSDDDGIPIVRGYAQGNCGDAPAILD